MTPVYLAPPQERRSQAPLVGGVVVGLLAIAPGAWWLTTQQQDQKSETTSAPAAVSSPAAPPQAAQQPVPQQAAPQGSQQAAQQQPAPQQVPPQQAPQQQAPQQPAPAPAPRPSEASPTQEGPTDAENEDAERRLKEQYALDSATFDRSPHAFAQLSSKRHDTVHPMRTSRGTKRWQSVDILEQHRDLRARYGDVRLVKGYDVGSAHGQYADYWITLYDPGFSSKAEANAWCKRNFGGDDDLCFGAVTK